MPPDFAQRTAEMRPFLAMEVMERAFAMERAGEDVIHLEIGEPDFPAHPAAAKACIRAIESGQTHYTDSRGLSELREAIADDHGRRFGVDVEPERIIVSNGTSPAMLLVFSLLVGEGDEVVLGAPHYPCYPNFIRLSGGVPVAVPMDPETGYAMDVEAVRAALTPRTRAIVVSSPANPTGAVQSEETLRGLASLGIPIISDEIYDGLLYDGAKVTSALQISDDAYVLDGFSKRYAMTGYRLGYAIVPRESARAIQVMQQNLFISTNCFVQHAGESLHLDQLLRPARGRRGAARSLRRARRDARRLHAPQALADRRPARTRLPDSCRAEGCLLRLCRRPGVRFGFASTRLCAIGAREGRHGAGDRFWRIG